MLEVIVNPISGKLKKTNALERVENLLKEKEIPYILHHTQESRHATQLAAEAAAHGNNVLVMGGDGTLSEAAGGMLNTDSTLYIAPCGTGNDFVKALGLPIDPEQALRMQLEGTPCRVDAGMMNERCFLNVFGTGFDVEVLRETERFKKHMTGIFPYLMGIVAAIRRFKPQEMTVTVNGETIRQKIIIIAAANGQYIGGGMKVSPFSDARDGLLDINYVEAVPKPKMLVLLPTFITGSFTKFKYTHMTRTQEITIARKGMTVDVDGELIDTDCAHIRILPGALHMCLPQKKSSKY